MAEEYSFGEKAKALGYGFIMSLIEVFGLGWVVISIFAAGGITGATIVMFPPIGLALASVVVTKLVTDRFTDMPGWLTSISSIVSGAGAFFITYGLGVTSLIAQASGAKVPARSPSTGLIIAVVMIAFVSAIAVIERR